MLRRYIPITLLTVAFTAKKQFGTSTSCTAKTPPNYAKLQLKLKEIEDLTGIQE
jgi:hypothetical protein